MKKLFPLIAVIALALSWFLKGELVNASYNSTVTEASDSIQYILVNKADAPAQTCCFWNTDVPDPQTIPMCDYKDKGGKLKVDRPQNCSTDKFENAIQEIKALISVPDNKTVKLGVQMVVPYFNISSKQAIEEVEKLIKLAEDENMPVAFKLDGITDWKNRPDLWNWFDPSLPGYNPENNKNVEWADWTEDAAVKIAWRNFGQQERIRPAPNLGSTKYIEAKKTQLQELLPIIADWYNKLPKSKKHLLAGVILDNELSLWNHQFYPNGNKYYELCPKYDNECAKIADDPNLPMDGSAGPSFGRQAIGHAAVKSFGIKLEGKLTQQDVDQAVKNHAQILAQTVQKYLPPDKVFIHGMWNVSGDKPSGGISYHNVVTDIVAPGWTMYGWGLQGFLDGERFPKSSQELKEAIKRNRVKIWGATEWSAIEPASPEITNTFPNWNYSLLQTLSSEGNKLLVVYSLNNIRDNRKDIVPAIQNIINRAPADPNYIQEDPVGNFYFTKQTSECQIYNKPVVYLSWGKYQKAIGYRISKTDRENQTSYDDQTLLKDTLLFNDPNVLPGRTYIYIIQAIIPNSNDKPTLTATIVAGSCNADSSKDNSTLSCKPSEKIIQDQTGKSVCVNKPCQERSSEECNSDGKCSLQIRDGYQSCVIKTTNQSAFVSSFGSDIETAVSSLCQNLLSGIGINLDKHLSLCKQKALDTTNGCLTASDLNGLIDCIQKVTKKTVDELTPGFTQTATASQLSQEEAVAVLTELETTRTPKEVYLQSADGEKPLSIEGDVISFPVNKLDPELNVIQVKIVFDKPDKNGINEITRTFKVKRVQSVKQASSETTVTDNQPAQEQISSKNPSYDETCWEMERNECTGCGISQTVERYACEGTPWFNQLRTKPGTEGQKDADCALYEPASLTFLRNECTGCKKARRVKGCPNEVTAVTQTDIDDDGCADRCQEETRTSCETEDLAFYCEGDNVAVYKYRDNSCQIQFSTVKCRKRGQICRDGDCIDE